MKIIEKIEISKFRSIGEKEMILTADLNVFSGSNDSGKSNFLKALNLFFNGQTDINVRYNPDNDFNKWYRDNNIRGQRVIEITLHIAPGNYSDKGGINEGFIAKKEYRTDGGFELKIFTRRNILIPNEEKSYKKANAIINEKIKFIYIPTIRDEEFRKNVQRQIQEIANSTDKRFKSKDLKDAFEKMETGIDSQLKDLTTYVKEKMGVEIETNVNFATLLESLTFETSEKIKIRKKGKKALEVQKVNLKNRGEGIQMQFFSILLWFISKNDTKHTYIWGYEEPEIAFEFKRQFEIVEIFKDTFSKSAQIFVTTHSPAFAFADADSKTHVFRINYEKQKGTTKERYISKLVPIEEYYDGLFKELTHASAESKKGLERDIWGINAQKISKMIGESLDEIIGVRHISNGELLELKDLITKQQKEKEKFEQIASEVLKELESIFPEKVFICEDEKAIPLWEDLLFTKAGIDRTNFKIIQSKGCTNNQVETALLHLMTQKSEYQPKVFRQLDRDGFTAGQVSFLEKKKEIHNDFRKFKKYNVRFLPVNEIENFSITLDSFFSPDKLNDPVIRDKISDAFRSTVTANIVVALKICEKEAEKALFHRKEIDMIKEARTDVIRLFPGKDIKKIKGNFNPEKLLIETKFSNLPIELINYLNNIKVFFDNVDSNIPNST